MATKFPGGCLCGRCATNVLPIRFLWVIATAAIAKRQAAVL